MKSGIIGLAALALGGCATITRGSDELVAFQSEPPGAAVRTSIGAGCPTKDPFVASFELPGYRGEQVTVGTRMSGGGTAGVVGNVLFGGGIGVGGDSPGGAGLRHYPKPGVV